MSIPKMIKSVFLISISERQMVKLSRFTGGNRAVCLSPVRLIVRNGENSWEDFSNERLYGWCGDANKRCIHFDGTPCGDIGQDP